MWVRNARDLPAPLRDVGAAFGGGPATGPARSGGCGVAGPGGGRAGVGLPVAPAPRPGAHGQPAASSSRAASSRTGLRPPLAIASLPAGPIPGTLMRLAAGTGPSPSLRPGSRARPSREETLKEVNATRPASVTPGRDLQLTLSRCSPRHGCTFSNGRANGAPPKRITATHPAIGLVAATTCRRPGPPAASCRSPEITHQARVPEPLRPPSSGSQKGPGPTHLPRAAIGISTMRELS